MIMHITLEREIVGIAVQLLRFYCICASYLLFNTFSEDYLVNFTCLRF